MFPQSAHVPDTARLFMRNDYEWMVARLRRTTLLTSNIFTGGATSHDALGKFRIARITRLDMLKLIAPELQVNTRGGQVPTDKD